MYNQVLVAWTMTYNRSTEAATFSMPASAGEAFLASLPFLARFTAIVPFADPSAVVLCLGASEGCESQAGKAAVTPALRFNLQTSWAMQYSKLGKGRITPTSKNLGKIQWVKVLHIPF